jgi:hypothetical protein
VLMMITAVSTIIYLPIVAFRLHATKECCFHLLIAVTDWHVFFLEEICDLCLHFICSWCLVKVHLPLWILLNSLRFEAEHIILFLISLRLWLLGLFFH